MTRASQVDRVCAVGPGAADTADCLEDPSDVQHAVSH